MNDCPIETQMDLKPLHKCLYYIETEDDIYFYYKLDDNLDDENLTNVKKLHFTLIMWYFFFYINSNQELRKIFRKILKWCNYLEIQAFSFNIPKFMEKDKECLSVLCKTLKEEVCYHENKSSISFLTVI